MRRTVVRTLLVVGLIAISIAIAVVVVSRPSATDPPLATRDFPTAPEPPVATGNVHIDDIKQCLLQIENPSQVIDMHEVVVVGAAPLRTSPNFRVRAPPGRGSSTSVQWKFPTTWRLS